MLGGGYRVALRGVGDDNAALGGRLYVNVVHADAGAAYGLEVVGLLQDLSRYLGGAADYEAVVRTYLLQKLVRAQVQEDVHLEVLLEERDAWVGELLGDKDPQAVTPLLEKTRWAAPTPLPSSTGKSSDSSASSVAAIVAMMSKASKKPQCPMRKILPAISPCPPATCIPRSRNTRRTSCLPSIPSGTHAAVTAELRSSSGPKSSSPMPLIPALEARPSSTWRSKTFSIPSSRSCRSATSSWM